MLDSVRVGPLEWTVLSHDQPIFLISLFNYCLLTTCIHILTDSIIIVEHTSIGLLSGGRSSVFKMKCLLILLLTQTLISWTQSQATVPLTGAGKPT